MAGSMISRRMSISAWKGRSLGSAAKNRSSNWPAGVDQSISPVHQFSVEGMFARADAQEVEGLLNEPVGDFGISAEPARERLFARAHPPCFFADEDACGNAGLAPRAVPLCFNLVHG